MRLSYLALLQLSIIMIGKIVLGQNSGPNATGIFSNNTQGPLNDMNAVNIAQANSPLLVGAMCKYSWY